MLDARQLDAISRHLEARAADLREQIRGKLGEAADSVLATALRLGLPATVHPAFGAETGNVLSKSTIYAAVLFFVLAFALYLGRIYESKHAAAAAGSSLPSITGAAKPAAPAEPAPTAPITVPTANTPAPEAPKKQP